MDRLQAALQALVDEDYGQWGGVNADLREAVVAFNQMVVPGECDVVVIPSDAD